MLPRQERQAPTTLPLQTSSGTSNVCAQSPTIEAARSTPGGPTEPGGTASLSGFVLQLPDNLYLHRPPAWPTYGQQSGLAILPAARGRGRRDLGRGTERAGASGESFIERYDVNPVTKHDRIGLLYSQAFLHEPGEHLGQIHSRYEGVGSKDPQSGRNRALHECGPAAPTRRERR